VDEAERGSRDSKQSGEDSRREEEDRVKRGVKRARDQEEEGTRAGRGDSGGRERKSHRGRDSESHGGKDRGGDDERDGKRDFGRIGNNARHGSNAEAELDLKYNTYYTNELADEDYLVSEVEAEEGQSEDSAGDPDAVAEAQPDIDNLTASETDEMDLSAGSQEDGLESDTDQDEVESTRIERVLARRDRRLRRQQTRERQNQRRARGQQRQIALGEPRMTYPERR
jgi:hypothetical protein